MSKYGPHPAPPLYDMSPGNTGVFFRPVDDDIKVVVGSKGESVLDDTNPKDLLGIRKPNMHLIPPVANVLESIVMAAGAAKYGSYNWREKKVRASIYISAIYRHLAAWMDGENDDLESGVSHIASARACTGILLDAQSCNCLIDDRPPHGMAAATINVLTQEKLYEDKKN